MQTQELLPLSKSGKTVDSRKNWGMFGYKGYCLDLAIEMDDPDAMREAHKRGWIEKDSETTFSTPLRRHCENRGKTRAADVLKELGYPV
jgi:hypothetical protein